MNTSLKIGWIGAGKMGLPICKRLKAAGFEVSALARSKEKAAVLLDAGLSASSSVAEIGKAASIVFASVSDDAALHDVVFASGLAESMKRGSTFVDISTVSPAMSASVSTKLGERQIDFLRSPVSGSTSMAAAGTLTAVVSGPQASYKALAGVFVAFTKKTFHVGVAEEARYLKLVLNSMVAATAALLGEALALGRKGGLSNAQMLEVITQSAVASPLIGYKKDMIVRGDYAPAATLNMLAKDLDIFLSVGRETHTPLPASDAIRKIYEAASARGLGEQDFFVLVSEAARLAGLPNA
jgi:3-hydroxyisobutyrate dehydrogenase-like beta-hydroxyacid dehydrogenase